MGPITQHRINEHAALTVHLWGVAQTKPETSAFAIRVPPAKGGDLLAPQELRHQKQAAVIALNQCERTLRLRDQGIAIARRDRHTTLHI